ncbi:hypothetical protein [Orenia marismortui]|uniref:hypothetical protein n=1 Tax=Orenia marismortui TaxID=46469 RepID=UPI000361E758|nr:hypothetical protein [Orenia marismortui]
MSAGLLVVDDFRKVLYQYQEELLDIDLVLLPAVAFNYWGVDLVGERYSKLEDEFDIQVEIVG